MSLVSLGLGLPCQGQVQSENFSQLKTAVGSRATSKFLPTPAKGKANMVDILGRWKKWLVRLFAISINSLQLILRYDMAMPQPSVGLPDLRTSEDVAIQILTDDYKPWNGKILYVSPIVNLT